MSDFTKITIIFISLFSQFDMKLLSKAYLLIAILIGAAAINLLLFYTDSNSQTTQSYSIIRVGDVKVSAESISSLATSVASGNEQDKAILDDKINDVEMMIGIIKTGGTFNDLTLEKIPDSLVDDHRNLSNSWEAYRDAANEVETTFLLDPEAEKAQLDILDKNSELIILTVNMEREFENLGREYNRHKQISTDLVECAKAIGEQTLLLSSGNEQAVQEKLAEKRLQFEIGLRKLLQVPTNDLDVTSVGMQHEELIELSREHSSALRQIDPLWESMSVKLQILEEKGLFSAEYDAANDKMMEQKEIFYADIDTIIQDWTQEISKQGSEEQTIIQIILVVDIAVFFIVLFVIRQSLTPLGSIIQAIGRVREGVYGEKIEYSATDEVGQLVNDFNVMSNTIKEKEEEARKTDIAKDEFLAMITHELKTPLVPIQGYSDILLGEHLGKLTDKQRERIGIIKTSSETLLAIISDLLDAQKLELGQLKMKKENKNIKETIDKAIQTLIPEAAKTNIQISSNATDVVIDHDPDRIAQVITNLIKNSLIAVEAETGKVDVIMEDLPTEVKISVKDNGVGIPIEKQTDLFKKFYQVDATLTRERGGSGLGLAICKGIIDNHLGEISVNSVPNQGATFTFTIPKNPSAPSGSPIGSA